MNAGEGEAASSDAVEPHCATGLLNSDLQRAHCPTAGYGSCIAAGSRLCRSLNTASVVERFIR